MTTQSQAGRWPDWQQTLPASPQPRQEGGRRTQGIVTQPPLISYLTVTRNAGSTIERTIRSVIRQRSGLIEHIVIDGQSTDDTLRIIKQYEDYLDYYASEPDRSLYDAINKGIQVCRGSYICVLNADDWLTPRAVKAVTKFLSRPGDDTTIHAFGAWKVGQEKKNKLWPPRTVSIGDYLRCADLCHNAMYVPRRVYELTGPYDISLRIAADFKWMMAALDAGATYMAHRRPTVFYSLGGISTNAVGHAQDALRVLTARFPFLSQTQAQALFTRFHTFKENVRQYGVVADTEVQQILENIIQRGTPYGELQVAIKDAIKSECEQSRSAQAARRPKNRAKEAFQKSLWRIIDQ